MMNELAPIILFVYNRLEHTEQTVNALKANYLAEKSELYIFSDGPKTKEMQDTVLNVREYIRKITGFKKVTVVQREQNMGLASSVIAGVTEIVDKYGKVIVVEDDLVTSRFFLKYMNDALEKYKAEKKIFSITGYSFFERGTRKLPQTYFSTLTCSWTWATWKDRWDLFEKDADGWVELKKNEKKRWDFNYDGSYDYTEMLIAQMEKKSIDSWAIRWYYSSFKNNGLTLYVNKSLCINQGFDGTGTHGVKWNNDIYSEKGLGQREIDEFPTDIEELPKTRKLIKKSLKNSLPKTWIKRIINFGKRL